MARGWTSVLMSLLCERHAEHGVSSRPTTWCAMPDSPAPGIRWPEIGGFHYLVSASFFNFLRELCRIAQHGHLWFRGQNELRYSPP
jgi:hypothetical protein